MKIEIVKLYFGRGVGFFGEGKNYDGGILILF
jgi:hypothetical protein